jgi:hypothetical protein
MADMFIDTFLAVCGASGALADTSIVYPFGSLHERFGSVQKNPTEV